MSTIDISNSIKGGLELLKHTVTLILLNLNEGQIQIIVNDLDKHNISYCRHDYHMPVAKLLYNRQLLTIFVEQVTYSKFHNVILNTSCAVLDNHLIYQYGLASCNIFNIIGVPNDEFIKQWEVFITLGFNPTTFIHDLARDTDYDS